MDFTRTFSTILANSQAMPFASKYFVNEYFGDSFTHRLCFEFVSESGELGRRVHTAFVKNMTQPTRVGDKNMTQVTRVFSKNMTQPTRDLFRFTIVIHSHSNLSVNHRPPGDPDPQVR